MLAQTEHRLIRRESDIERIPPSLVRDLHAYWLKKRGGRAIPAWADVQPAEITRLLPNLIVAGIGHEPLQVRYRLAGTEIVEFRGEITGHRLGEVPWSSSAGQAVVMDGFKRAIVERIPLFSEVDITTRTGAHHQIFAGIWPLAPRCGAPIDRCLALEDYGNLSRNALS
ncbi:MAG: PAS domain-containing protein [Proteobacteria bacterium]|nr:PAS domain-containing protein [Pseudomonadota bacterium]